MLKNPFSPRLLKKVRMQGGAPGTRPQDGYRCEVYLVRTSQRRASAGVPTEGGSPQMGFFSSLLDRGVPGASRAYRRHAVLLFCVLRLNFSM
jgi:hypothetical protein